MPLRRSKFAVAAEQWFKLKIGHSAIETREFWTRFSADHPDLTTPTPSRKTPKATCMRDLRYDEAFEIGGGKIRLK